MLILRCVILVVAAIITGATESNVEILEASYYGLDEQNEPAESDNVEVLVPQLSDDLSQPTSSPESDNGRESRRGGRRHHNHRGRHDHRHHGSDDHRRSHHHSMRHGWTGNWTDEQKVTHLCSKLLSRDTSGPTDRATASTHGGRQRHGIQGKLRALNETSRQTIINVWNRRKQEMIRCCNEGTMDAKMQCVNNTKVARYDRVCSGDEPLCYWSLLMSSAGRYAPTTPATPNRNAESTTNIVSRCCAMRGTERVGCFIAAKTNYRQRMQDRIQLQSNTDWSRGNPRSRTDHRHRDHHQ